MVNPPASPHANDGNPIFDGIAYAPRTLMVFERLNFFSLSLDPK
jgi:hypothetical protein